MERARGKKISTAVGFCLRVGKPVWKCVSVEGAVLPFGVL